MSQGMLDPAPADLKVAQTAVPVRINEISFSHRHHGDPAADQVQGGCGQDQSQARQGLASGSGWLPVENRPIYRPGSSLRCQTQTKFIQGFQTGRLIAQDRPSSNRLGLHMRQRQ